jgi:ubiquinone/menaquinone biosynthesis C-methylase UbiE
VALREEVERALVAGTAGELAGDGPLLDLGCGTGWWLEALAARGIEPARLHGIDLAEERVVAARARVPGATVCAGDARQLPREDGTFAAVYLLLVLSSLESDAAVADALREARRVVRPGGAIAVWEPRVPTPWNPRTRWIRAAELQAGLGPETESRTLTLLPPLARRLGAATERLYPMLGAGGLLRTHRLWVWRDPTTHDRV